ncbi:hypothetical protein ND16A_0398 [Thalassotalea sp. ND16A]|nr:hypothetical protein ND16A_0398 [Thalassotalea sp. ND16A]
MKPYQFRPTNVLTLFILPTYQTISLRNKIKPSKWHKNTAQVTLDNLTYITQNSILKSNNQSVKIQTVSNQFYALLTTIEQRFLFNNLQQRERLTPSFNIT